MDYIKLTFLALAALYGGICAARPEEFHFLDGVNLLFHEAGHPIFGLFGNEFLMVLGGTLGQLIMPLIVIGSFIRSGQKYSAAVTGIWFAENFFNIARYARDAVDMDLPLVGNGDRIHDWNYMLTELDWLGRVNLVGNAIYYTGIVMLVLSVLTGLYFSREKRAEMP